MPIRPFFINKKPDQGKLLERVGRKTKDLNPIYKDMVAKLPGKNSSP